MIFGLGAIAAGAGLWAWLEVTERLRSLPWWAASGGRILSGALVIAGIALIAGS